MKRVQGSMDAALLKCISPIKNKWRVRWDFSSDDNSYMEEEFKYKPSLEEIKNLITSYYNDDIKCIVQDYLIDIEKLLSKNEKIYEPIIDKEI